MSEKPSDLITSHRVNLHILLSQGRGGSLLAGREDSQFTDDLPWFHNAVQLGEPNEAFDNEKELLGRVTSSEEVFTLPKIFTGHERNGPLKAAFIHTCFRGRDIWPVQLHPDLVSIEFGSDAGEVMNSSVGAGATGIAWWNSNWNISGTLWTESELSRALSSREEVGRLYVGHGNVIVGSRCKSLARK